MPVTRIFLLICAPQPSLFSGSHNGEKIHIDTVKKILKKAKLQESWLKCGTQAPLYYTVLGKLPNKAEKFTVLQHNCSGKHSGMMALSVYLGWKPQDYYKPEHPVQKLILKSVSELCNFPKNRIGLGTDGCSLPNFALPLKNMAYGFAHLAESVANQKTNPDPFGIIGKAMQKYPQMVSGKGRFDYVLAVASQGKVISKAGAEALSCVAVPEEKLGIAVRITDGASRAVAPVVIETLRQLEILNKNQLKKLANFYQPKVKNFNHWMVGQIKPEFKLKKVK